MASWGEFAETAPDLAELGSKLLQKGIAYLATVRPDGGPRDAEFSMRGTARRADEDRAVAVRAAEASGAGGLVESAERDAIFELDIERVDTAVWRKVGRPGTYPERKRWDA